MVDSLLPEEQVEGEAILRLWEEAGAPADPAVTTQLKLKHLTPALRPAEPEDMWMALTQGGSPNYLPGPLWADGHSCLQNRPRSLPFVL